MCWGDVPKFGGGRHEPEFIWYCCWRHWVFHPDWSLNYTASTNNIIFSVRQFDDYWILGLRGVISVDFGVKHSVTTGIIPTVLLRWKERTGCRRRSKYDMSKTQNPRVSQATKTGFLILGSSCFKFCFLASFLHSSALSLYRSFVFYGNFYLTTWYIYKVVDERWLREQSN